jgi:C-terminal peptidase prc
MSQSHRLRILILIPPLIFSLACQSVFSVSQPITSPTSTSLQKGPTKDLSPTPLALFQTQALTPLQTQPLLTPTTLAKPTLAPTASAQHIRIFEDLWQIVDEEYLYPDYNGLDWAGIHKEYLTKITSGIHEDEFYAAMYQMISRLGDNHSVYLTPEEAAEEDLVFAGKNDFVGIGIITTTEQDRQRIVIVAVFHDSPAEKAGLKPRDSILAADGQAVVDAISFRRRLLPGPEGSTIELIVQSPGEESRRISIERRRITGPVPVPFSKLTTTMGKHVGYILISTFADETTDDQVEQALRALNSDPPLDGLILDNRQNTGGADTVVRNTLSFFTSGRLGYFIDRQEHVRTLNVIGADINGSSKIPLVVLIGPNTISFGEIFAGVLKDTERAYLIGDNTTGNIELLWGYDFEDGSRAWIAHERFQPLENPSQDWEQTGIIPDLHVSCNWDEVTLDNDPAVQAALIYLDSQVKE